MIYYKTPGSWRAHLGTQEQNMVKVLPLGNEKGQRAIGWCTAGFDLEAPDTEVMCGGINTKLPSHAALWRQGNLLHFGFQNAPGQMNDNGKTLLINSIHYIARFTEDKPIETNRTPLSKGGFSMTRYFLSRTLESKRTTATNLAQTFASPWDKKLAAMKVPEAKKWVRGYWSFIRNKGNKLILDEDAVELGVPLDKPVLFEKLPSCLADPKQAAVAVRLMARLIPSGPGAKADAGAWKEWLAKNRKFLFFSEASGFVWLEDPLARKRGVASTDLRGPKRATGG